VPLWRTGAEDTIDPSAYDRAGGEVGMVHCGGQTDAGQGRAPRDALGRALPFVSTREGLSEISGARSRSGDQ
jgi:hypothetical protein